VGGQYKKEYSTVVEIELIFPLTHCKITFFSFNSAACMQNSTYQKVLNPILAGVNNNLCLTGSWHFIGLLNFLKN